MSSYRGRHRQATKPGKALGWVGITGTMAAVPFGLAMGTAHASTHDWSGVAQCESGGNWSTNTGNGFSGGLQFTQSTWAANGGTGSPANASKAEQIRVAENVLASQGAGAWPVCGKYLTSGGGDSSQDTSTQTTSDNSNSGDSTSQVQQAASQAADQVQTQAQNVTNAVGADSPVGQAISHASAQGANYIVQAGDTLAQIAQQHDVAGGWQQLFQQNKDVLSNPNLIFQGQGLVVK